MSTRNMPKSGRRARNKAWKCLISARSSSTGINSFLDPVMEPVEDTLAQMDIIHFPGTPEITFYKQGFILDLPTTDSVWGDHVLTAIELINEATR